MQIISDIHMVEGITGGLGTAIFYIMMTHPRMIFKHMGVRLGFAFFFTWLMRKITINVYKDMLRPRGIRIPKIEI